MRTTTCLGVLLAMFAGSSAWAQTMPDAGSLMRQNEQMFRPNPANTPRREALAPPMTLDASTAVAVKRIQFAGNKHLSLAQLRQVANPYEGRTLSAQDLQHLTYAVSEAYRQVGWVVQAYVPRQNLHTGDLLVQIVETVPPSSAP
jgi:hemolysin activation/secretion protein